MKPVTSHIPRVAIAADFLEAFARLPRAQQKKVREFTEKFREDPLQRGINYERIHDMRDEKVRTVRIDQSYRAIVIHPPSRDVYLLVWVDHHDEAMAWAKNKVFEVNPVLGSLQIYEVNEAPQAVSVGRDAATSSPSDSGALSSPGSVPNGRLLSGKTREDLVLCGVPTPLLPAVRALQTDGDLDELAPHLPTEASDALYMLAAGFTVEQALEQAGRTRATTPVDVQDFAAALQQPESKRRFAVLEGERQLKEILLAPLEQWRIFLHPTQQALVNMQAKGPVRVLGGPGTGKTVAALHRAKHLAVNVFAKKEDRILFTTYTKNLAKDIARQLSVLCDEGTADRIEVTNLHQWAVAFLKWHKIQVKLPKTSGQYQSLWEEATGGAGELIFPEAFYRDEWSQIIQANGILERDDYLRAKRTGRGTPLTRGQRLHVWVVLEKYRAVLDQNGIMEFADVIREACLLLEREQAPSPYRAVVVDEIQDLTPLDFRLLRAIAPRGENDMFLVGDAHQRIYAHTFSLSACGIETRGRARRLKINYRTTHQVKDWAMTLLTGTHSDDLDGGEDSLKGYRSIREGIAPTVKLFRTPEEETEFIIATIQAWRAANPSKEICLAGRTHRLLRERYGPMLKRADVLFYEIEDGQAPDAVGIALATMHRVKGLEFPLMILGGVQEGEVPAPRSMVDLYDRTAAVDHEERERRLLFVAATRARDELVVTGFGRPSPLVLSKG
jgi:superfamily I DNA/RNA helicase